MRWACISAYGVELELSSGLLEHKWYQSTLAQALEAWLQRQDLLAFVAEVEAFGAHDALGLPEGG